MVASKFDGNATLSLWVHRYFTKDCFIDAVTSSCSDLFGFIASPLNWHFGGSTMVHPIFRHRYIYGLWFGTFFIFPYIGNFIIPTDFHSIIFQRGRAQPPCRFVDGMDDRAAAAKAGMIAGGEAGIDQQSGDSLTNEEDATVLRFWANTGGCLQEDSRSRGAEEPPGSVGWAGTGGRATGGRGKRTVFFFRLENCGFHQRKYGDLIWFNEIIADLW